MLYCFGQLQNSSEVTHFFQSTALLQAVLHPNMAQPSKIEDLNCKIEDWTGNKL